MRLKQNRASKGALAWQTEQGSPYTGAPLVVVRTQSQLVGMRASWPRNPGLCLFVTLS